MTITEIARFSYRQSGRGLVKHGVYEVELTGYVNGTGFTFEPDDFRVKRLVQVNIQPVDCQGVMFDWAPATGVLKAYTANATEAANDSLDGKKIRCTYWGY